MQIFLASLLVIGLAVLAMSLGVILGRPALRGSCGGDCLQCAAGCGGNVIARNTEETG